MLRRFLMASLASTFLGASALSACGIDAVGSREPMPGDNEIDASSDGSNIVPPDPDTGSIADSGTDANDGSTDPLCGSTGTECLNALSPGWIPVSVSTASNDACAPGDTTIDLIDADFSDACDCTPAASPQDPPSCTKDPAYTYKNACTFTTTVNVTEGACVPLQVGTALAEFSTIKPYTGTCDAKCSPAQGKVKTSNVRICEPSASACHEEICQKAKSSNDGGSVNYCVLADGDQAKCPDGFGQEKKLVGSNPTVTCENMQCTNAVVCSNPMIQLFTDKDCTQPKGTVSTSKCMTISDKNNVAAAFKYQASIVSPTSMTGTPTAHFDSVKTLCCP